MSELTVDAREVLATLKRIRNPDSRRRALRRGMQAAARVQIRQARKYIRHRSKALSKGLTTRQRFDEATEEVEITIRARSKKDANGNNPARYLHIVERGAKWHIILGPLTLHGRVYAVVIHPGAKATHALERASKDTQDKAFRQFQKTINRLVYGK